MRYLIQFSNSWSSSSSTRLLNKLMGRIAKRVKDKLAKAKALSLGLSNAYFISVGLPSLFEEC